VSFYATIACSCWHSTRRSPDQQPSPTRRSSDLVLYVLANVAYLNVLPAAAIASAPQDRVGTAALHAILGEPGLKVMAADPVLRRDRKSTRLNSSHGSISYAVFCLKKKKNRTRRT